MSSIRVLLQLAPLLIIMDIILYSHTSYIVRHTYCTYISYHIISIEPDSAIGIGIEFVIVLDSREKSAFKATSNLQTSAQMLHVSVH